MSSPKPLLRFTIKKIPTAAGFFTIIFSGYLYFEASVTQYYTALVEYLKYSV